MRPAAHALLLCLFGCASSAVAPPNPSATTTRLIAALKGDDARAVYDLMHPDLQRETTYEDFARRWADSREESVALAERLEQTGPSTWARARVPMATGHSAVLVFEQGGWRIEGGVLDAQALRTPLDAVGALRAALQQRDLEGLLGVLSRDQRAAWLASFEQSIEQTGDPLDMEVEMRGTEAVVRTSGGTEIHLRREAGKWRVHQIRQVP